MDKFEFAPSIGIDTFSDLEKLPDFHQNVKLTSDLIVGAVVVEPYVIPSEKIPCGLTCRTAHNRGYLLRLPDGSYTNVGQDCGSKHFGASGFDAQIKKLNEKERDERKKQIINDLLEHKDSLRQRASKLQRETIPFYKAITNFKALCPNEILNDLRNRAQRKQYTVNKTRKMNDVEKSAFSEKNTAGGSVKNHYIEEFVGLLKGMDIFLIHPRSCLKEVNNMISNIENSDNDLSKRRLAEFSKYKTTIEEHLNTAEYTIKQKDKFFEQRNFELLPHLCEGKFKNKVERIDWDFQSNIGQLLSQGQFKRKMQRQSAA